jgi:transcriptional regulator GlxA family with amidase domain
LAEVNQVKVEEDRIFIVDGPIWTPAGMTAGIDLALAMIEQDPGADMATWLRAVARKLASLSPARRRPVAVFRATGVGAQIGPYSDQRSSRM